MVILIVIAIFVLFTMNTKIQFLKTREGAKKLRAKVIEYRAQKGPMRNDFTKLNYPFVNILSEDEQLLRKLRYANSTSKPFKIGEEIDVFFSGGDLLYWDTYNRGLYRFLPESWTKWKKYS